MRFQTSRQLPALRLGDMRPFPFVKWQGHALFTQYGKTARSFGFGSGQSQDEEQSSVSSPLRMTEFLNGPATRAQHRAKNFLRSIRRNLLAATARPRIEHGMTPNVLAWL